jgi:hypothetical protein
MKLQLDTTAKTIKIENDVLLGEFFEKIMVILPNDSWREFKLLTETKIKWGSPIIIKDYPTYPWWPQTPYEPYPYHPWITYGETTKVTEEKPYYTFNAGIYNIDLQ